MSGCFSLGPVQVDPDLLEKLTDFERLWQSAVRLRNNPYSATVDDDLQAEEEEEEDEGEEEETGSEEDEAEASGSSSEGDQIMVTFLCIARFRRFCDLCLFFLKFVTRGIGSSSEYPPPPLPLPSTPSLSPLARFFLTVLSSMIRVTWFSVHGSSQYVQAAPHRDPHAVDRTILFSHLGPAAPAVVVHPSDSESSDDDNSSVPHHSSERAASAGLASLALNSSRLPPPGASSHVPPSVRTGDNNHPARVQESSPSGHPPGRSRPTGTSNTFNSTSSPASSLALPSSGVLAASSAQASGSRSSAPRRNHVPRAAAASSAPVGDDANDFVLPGTGNASFHHTGNGPRRTTATQPPRRHHVLSSAAAAAGPSSSSSAPLVVDDDHDFVLPGAIGGPPAGGGRRARVLTFFIVLLSVLAFTRNNSSSRLVTSLHVNFLSDFELLALRETAHSCSIVFANWPYE